MTQMKPKTRKETKLTWTTGYITDTPTITPQQSRYLIMAERCVTQRLIDLLTDILVDIWCLTYFIYCWLDIFCRLYIRLQFLHEIIYETYSRMGSTSVCYTTELRNDLQVQIISYNGDIGIDIRKWCLSSYSKTFPTKHGIRLNPQNWARFQMSTIIILTSIKSSLESQNKRDTHCQPSTWCRANTTCVIGVRNNL